MFIDDFIRATTFHFIKPETMIPENVLADLGRNASARVELERSNTVFPRDIRGVLPALYEIGHNVPRLSTLIIGMLIHEIVAQMPKDQCYVNVGVWHGYSLCAAFPGNPTKHCIGVDNFSQFGSPRDACQKAIATYATGANHILVERDYWDYFKTEQTMPIGFYFYDGEHDEENQRVGLEVAEPFFAPGCIVMVDDTNWEGPRKGTMDFLAKRPGQYRIICDLPTACNGHPTWWNGLTVLEKIS